MINGGDIIASVLVKHGVEQLFTLCGGHISPILVSAKREGIRVVDVRDEASAVFAADAVARMTGIPGVAAVTAGPGLTNTLTAVENAKLAQTPLIILGGATATLLRGRGALQDIDQMALMAPAVKHAIQVTRVRKLGPAMAEAFAVAQEGVPGPVFVEVPLDLLYPEAMVTEMFLREMGGGSGLFATVRESWVKQHFYRVFRGSQDFVAEPPAPTDAMDPPESAVDRAADLLATAKRPVLVIGSQTLARPGDAEAIADAVRTLGVPVFLGGSARGLLGRADPLQYRHKRTAALKQADVVVVAGFPFDFRMGYGFKINGRASIVQVNRDKSALNKNRRATLPVHADAGRFLQALARRAGSPWEGRWADWFHELTEREEAREAFIDEVAAQETEYVNPLALCRRIEEVVADDSVLIVDGGDFVATASYIVKPRQPLSWLDPGVFGTLGVGGGFAVGAATVRTASEIWLFYGDGASAYSLAEFDTLARHGLPVIAVIGTDGSWAQIARDQVVMLGDDVGTTLERTAYHTVAKGYGAKGLLLKREGDIGRVLAAAKAAAAEGTPVVINAWIGHTDFRKGSISI